jgi:hypothetical protein
MPRVTKKKKNTAGSSKLDKKPINDATLPGVEPYNKRERGGEVVAHPYGAEGDVGALPREGEDDLHHRLSHRCQHVRPVNSIDQ